MTGAATVAGAARALPAPAAAEPLNKRRFIAFIAMVFGMFMAILDIQIVSASLPQIQAGLGASADQIPWVQTSYLIAEVIMIPLSGYLSRSLSTRVVFTISAGGFTIMSLMCATATTIEQMIVYRALQGFLGGGMIPTVFAAAYTVFPPDKKPIVSPIIGLVATMAPTIGPTVGGYLTDIFSWHWLFLVNIIPGVIVTVMAATMIDFDEPDYKLLKRFDWLGLITMALFLGSLEFVLEEGPLKDWYEDEYIFIFTVIGVCSAGLFFWRALSGDEPVVNLRAFSNRNFATGSLFSFVMGIGLYGLTYLYPIYLARIRDYTPLQIGETMFVTGAVMFISAPIIGRLSAVMDPRVLIGIGFAAFGVGTWMVTGITADWDFWELLVPQMLRGAGIMACMVPINNIALGTLPPDEVKNASGLFNLTRNLGGAVGLALINTMLNGRMDLHLQRLAEHVSWGRDVALERLSTLTGVMAARGSDAETAALKQLAQLVRREAMVMAFADVFYMLTFLFLGLILLTPFIKRPEPDVMVDAH